MLVLTRKQSEQIRINDEIIVTVEHVQGKRVKISIQAPQHYSIQRGELAEQAHSRIPAELFTK